MSTRHPLAGLSGRSLVTTDDLTDSELSALLDLARDLRATPGRPLLAGQVLGMCFFNPSLRTRASFEAAMFGLGGHAIHLSIGQGVWRLEHRDGVVMDGEASEHLKEAVPVLSQYCDLLGVRCFAGGQDWDEDRQDPILSRFIRHSTVPVINLESAMYHPCQGLADLLTLHDHLKAPRRRKVLLTWAYHPKALPMAVPNSFALAATRAGVDLTISHPPGFDLDARVLQRVRDNARLSGGTVTTTTDFASAFDGAEVVYAKAWGSRDHYGDEAAGRASRETFKDRQVTESTMARGHDAVFMHCLPVRRNVVVADEVLDGPRSIVVAQAANRLHVQKALLVAVSRRSPFVDRARAQAPLPTRTRTRPARLPRAKSPARPARKASAPPRR